MLGIDIDEPYREETDDMPATRATKHPTRFADLPQPVIATVEEIVGELSRWPLGRHAISIGGSIGKGNYDGSSDIDLRLWHEGELPSQSDAPDRWQALSSLIKRSEQRGVIVDGVWMRRIDRIDATLRAWLAGQGRPEETVWTVWGYHLPVDVFNQCVVRDDDQILAAWRQLLTPYPNALRDAVLARFIPQLRYWRSDYHYRNKVAREDAVFLASLTATLVHAVIQVLFAINDEYYVGDGANLAFVERFAIRPPDFASRVAAVLYPGKTESADMFAIQAEGLAGLIDDTLRLVP